MKRVGQHRLHQILGVATSMLLVVGCSERPTVVPAPAPAVPVAVVADSDQRQTVVLADDSAADEAALQALAALNPATGKPVESPRGTGPRVSLPSAAVTAEATRLFTP